MTDAPEQPLIAVDVVPLTFAGAVLRAGTVTRASAPHAGREALPGVLLVSGERIRAAALRALATKAQTTPRWLLPVGTFDRPGRESRQHAISIAWLAAIAPEEPGRLHWRDPSAVEDLPFDHAEIVEAAIAQARHHLWSDVTWTRALIGDEFTGPDALALETALTGRPAHAGNLQRLLSNLDGLRRSGFESRARRGRPAVVWRWED